MNETSRRRGLFIPMPFGRWICAKSIQNLIDEYINGNNRPLQSASLRPKGLSAKHPQEFTMYDSYELEDLHLQVVCNGMVPCW